MTGTVPCADCGRPAEPIPGNGAYCGSCAELRVILRFAELDGIFQGEEAWDLVPVNDLLLSAFMRGERIPERVGELPDWLRRHAAASRERVRRFEADCGDGTRVVMTHPGPGTLDHVADRIDAWVARRGQG